MEMAAHLYIGIQAFFSRHADLRRRPFFITGESYAGKYVPSIGARQPVSFLLLLATLVLRFSLSNTEYRCDAQGLPAYVSESGSA